VEKCTWCTLRTFSILQFFCSAKLGFTVQLRRDHDCNSSAGVDWASAERGGEPTLRDSAVLAADRVQPHLHHLAQHSNPVLHRADVGAFIVRPLHWDLGHFQPQAPRQKKDLRVEAPALNLQIGKNELGRLSSKCLESALRILKLEAKDEVQRDIE